MKKIIKALLLLMLCLCALAFSVSCNGDGGEDDGTGEGDTMKILVIGDASISDSVSYLPEMLHGSGLSDVTVATMVYNFNSGVSLSSHVSNISGNKDVYTVSTYGDGENIKEYSLTFHDGLTMYGWDYIAIGQSIPEAGLINTYEALADVIDYIDENKTNENAKILWHMPWALNNGSAVEGFEEYDNDEDKMYEAIVEVTKGVAMSYERLDGIVPTGTVIQNMRQTFVAPYLENATIRLSDLGKLAAAYAWCSYLTGADTDSLSQLELPYKHDAAYMRIARDSAVGAIANAYTITVPEIKSISILAFGNSYSNDAMTYLNKIFLSAGYDIVILGSVMTGGCNIYHHWSNLDDTLEDYHPESKYDGMTGIEGTASCSISVNGKGESVNGATLKERYANTVSAYDWDYITIQHAPNEVEQADTYERLPDLLGFIKDNLTGENTQFIFHMIWKYNDTNSEKKQRTSYQYDTIIDIAKNVVLVNEEFSGVIPAVTMRQNIVSSFLDDMDIARDYGHMGLTLGRYSLGLLWYCYLTGGSVEDVTFVPTDDNVSSADKTKYANEYGHIHLDITEADMLVVREAIENALAKPFEVTQSQYVTAP